MFALPFMPGHQPLHVTDILGLVFVLTGLIVYRFGSQLYPLFSRIGAGGERMVKAAASIRGRASARSSESSPALPLGEHRKPLLDLAERDEEDEDGDTNVRRRWQGGGGSRGRENERAVDDEWEM